MTYQTRCSFCKFTHVHHFQLTACVYELPAAAPAFAGFEIYEKCEMQELVHHSLRSSKVTDHQTCNSNKTDLNMI